MLHLGRLGFLMPSRNVVLVQLLGAIGTFKFMTFARNAKHANGHNKDGE